MRVPLVDLAAQYKAHREEFEAAIAQVVGKSAFIGGEFVQDFEGRYAIASGANHCISCANGTDAIFIALKMLGIGPEHEVITTASSWISTSEAISLTGARPVFVDVDDYFLIDTTQIESRITARTSAVVPVHLYGQAAAMSRIMEIANRHQLKVVEDCAQAHFAEWGGQRVGTFGDAGTFSFYPSKNLGAWGDAGAIVTNSKELARLIRMYANHGALVKHQHELEGINSRLDGLQAALLTAKLKYVEGWTEQRRSIAAAYNEQLEGIGDLELPRVRNGATHVYHLYVVKTNRRDELKAFLKGEQIDTAIHYPTALPLLPAYRHFGMSVGDVPRAAADQGRILSLPIYPEMTDGMVDYVVATVRKFFDG